MPRFILNTIFTVPGLPQAPVYGFADNFNRPNAATPGVTSGENKPWNTVSGGATVNAGIESNRLYISRSGTSSHAAIVADSGLANGTFKAKIAEVGDHIGGLALRVAGNINTHIMVSTRYQAGNNRYELRDLVNGAQTSLGVSSVTSATGDIVEVILNGSSVILKVNGIVAISATTAIINGTQHGFYANIGTTIRWDDASFGSA